jgi:metal-responsive CopG/Arc/MetJ family transcriptional regulator
MVMARNQTLVQLSDELLAALDEEATRSKRSRSELIRAAITHYLATTLGATADQAIVAGYSEIPQQPDAWADLAARHSIAEEPW